MNYNRLSKIFFTIITFALIIFLINSQFLENFIWKGDKKFIDFTILISWLECNYLGFDVYDFDGKGRFRGNEVEEWKNDQEC